MKGDEVHVIFSNFKTDTHYTLKLDGPAKITTVDDPEFKLLRTRLCNSHKTFNFKTKNDLINYDIPKVIIKSKYFFQSQVITPYRTLIYLITINISLSMLTLNLL